MRCDVIGQRMQTAWLLSCAQPDTEMAALEAVTAGDCKFPMPNLKNTKDLRLKHVMLLSLTLSVRSLSQNLNLACQQWYKSQRRLQQTTCHLHNSSKACDMDDTCATPHAGRWVKPCSWIKTWQCPSSPAMQLMMP